MAPRQRTHAGSTAVPEGRRRAVQPAARPGQALAELQAAAGNRAVAALVGGGQPVVQRVAPPKHPAGLAHEQSIGSFADSIKRKAQDLASYGDQIPGWKAVIALLWLMEELNQAFRKHPVKVVPIVFAGAPWGAFDTASWRMKIGLSHSDTVSRNDFLEFCTTLYHESRHAEQAFLEARYFAEASPDLTSPAQVKEKHGLRLADEAMELAMKVAEQKPLTGPELELVAYLRDPSTGLASSEEAFKFIAKFSPSGSFGGVLSTLKTMNLRDIKSGLVNAALDAAKGHAKQLRGVIVGYNTGKPTDISAIQDESNDDAIATLRRYAVAWQTRGVSEATFLTAYRNYLEVRRFQALDELRTAWVAYAVKFPTEADAHGVEAVLRGMVGLPAGLDRYEIPDPRDWTKG